MTKSSKTSSASDYEMYLRTARRRARKVSPRLKTRRERAWAVARRAATYIKEKYPTSRVRAFGSLLYPDSFGRRSDIDLAVEGIPWPEYLRVWSALEKREADFQIDLVDVGIVSEGLRQHIQRESVPL